MKNIPTTTTMRKLHIRITESTDLTAIVAIYNQAIPSDRSTANTTPLTVESRTAWFLEHEPDNHLIFVAKVTDQLIG